MHIIKATEAIVIEHPIFLDYGPPGICKTSLAYSMRDPLLLDFDRGAHRAANRRDTLPIDVWSDVTALNANVLAPYGSIIVDTVGRCLDVITADIAEVEPKKAPGGQLSQQGWGTLKNRFRTWMAQLRAQGKDVLLVAHEKEDKDGDTRIVRPDIVGGSYGEVLKVADFVGYIYMVGKNRVIDFNPTDRWIGKNPGGWLPLKVPPVDSAQTFMADLFDRGREALGKISEASAVISVEVEEWRQEIDTIETPEECTRMVGLITKDLQPIVQPQIKKLLWDRAKSLGFTFNTTTKVFVVKPPKSPQEDPAPLITALREA